eukprot:m.271978 g.271978  ORF g.271978 m.271978 type:complete len:60 (+) comp19746_c0_seq48:5780-5959(+)
MFKMLKFTFEVVEVCAFDGCCVVATSLQQIIILTKLVQLTHTEHMIGAAQAWLDLSSAG